MPWRVIASRGVAVVLLVLGLVTFLPASVRASRRRRRYAAARHGDPDPLWAAGVTVFDERGVPDHVARVNTFTTPPMNRDREFTGHGVLTLYASTDQTDLDLFVKVSLIPSDTETGA